MSVRGSFSKWVTKAARMFGRRIVDARTGECVGRAFVWFWRGRLVMVGLDPRRALYPVFKVQRRAVFWKQEVEFRSHPEPDFPDERRDP